jgi:hypothetical protein
MMDITTKIPIAMRTFSTILPMDHSQIIASFEC